MSITLSTIVHRLKLVAARDGLLPTFLSGIHNDFYTPLPAILVQVCISMCCICVHVAMNITDRDAIVCYIAKFWMSEALVFFM